MSVLCKVFGHKHRSQRVEPLRFNGWNKYHNQAYTFHEVGYICDRCMKTIPVGMVALAHNVETMNVN